MSYNAWKLHNPAPIENNKENVRHECRASASPQIFNRKQVRFENSARNNYVHHAVETQQPKQQFVSQNQQTEHSEPQKLLPSSTLISKPFEQIYMENIPNRHLDLSIIDAPNIKTTVRTERNFYDDNTTSPRVQKEPDTIPSNSHHVFDHFNQQNYQNSGRTMKKQEKFNLCDDSFFEISKNKTKHTGLVDLYNYKPHVPTNKPMHSDDTVDNIPTTYNSYKSMTNNRKPTKFETSKHSQEATEEPSVKDLLKIIQHQNEQLLVLQKQVASLLTAQDNLKQIEPPPPSEPKHIYGLKNTQHETMALFAQQHDEQPKSSKFAIDVMTSFEVSIRPPPHFNRNKFVKDYLQSEEAKIQEIYENDNVEKLTEKLNNSGDDSKLSMCEPVVVNEPPPSPDNSIHVDMQDYSSEYV